MNISILEQKNKSLYKQLIELEELNNKLEKEFKHKTTPLVARIFPELVTKDLVGVKPMMAPAGFAYALRYRYVTKEDLNHDNP